jgi:hypothetical protein
MSDEEREQSQERESRPARRSREDVLSVFLERQRRTEEMLNSPALRIFTEQQSWLKAMSGAAAMPTDITKFFSRGDVAFAGSVLADYERMRWLLGSVNPALDASRQLRALTSAGTLPALREATLAHQRLAWLVQPLDFPQITRDLTGVSGAVASVAGMIGSPALDVGREVRTIASSALGSWRTYVDALPPTPVGSDLLRAQAAGRGALGVVASSAILLGDDEAVEIAKEWELAPAQMRTRMREGLAEISPRLVVRLDGAWDAVVHAGPDSVSQAANSAIEVIDWTLRLGCDAEELRAWVDAQLRPAFYRDNNGRPTREAKIRYLLRGRGLEADFVAATARNLGALHRELQKLKHTHGEHDVDAVARLLPSVEAVLILIVD